MYPAFSRLFAEYPSESNGLSQVQNTILQLLDHRLNVAELFSQYQNTEDARFMGDSIFILVLKALIECKTPLIQVEGSKDTTSIWQKNVTRTTVGSDVVNLITHHLNINEIDFWVGGVHLLAPNIWCYNNQKGQFCLWKKND